MHNTRKFHAGPPPARAELVDRVRGLIRTNGKRMEAARTQQQLKNCMPEQGDVVIIGRPNRAKGRAARLIGQLFGQNMQTAEAVVIGFPKYNHFKVRFTSEAVLEGWQRGIEAIVRDTLIAGVIKAAAIPAVDGAALACAGDGIIPVRSGLPMSVDGRLAGVPVRAPGGLMVAASQLTGSESTAEAGGGGGDSGGGSGSGGGPADDRHSAGDSDGDCDFELAASDVEPEGGSIGDTGASTGPASTASPLVVYRDAGTPRDLPPAPAAGRRRNLKRPRSPPPSPESGDVSDAPTPDSASVETDDSDDDDFVTPPPRAGRHRRHAAGSARSRAALARAACRRK